MPRPKPRLLLVSEYFWPDQASTGRLLGELMACLKREYEDWTIDVLTSRRVYRGVSPEKLPKTEVWQGIRISRLASLRSGVDSFARRALSDLVFSARAALHAAVAHHNVIVVVTNPPLMPLLVALLAGLSRKRFLYIIHDLYPDVPVALGLWRADGLVAGVTRTLQRYALRKARRVVVLGRCMREHLVSAYGVEPKKVEVIPNWATVPVAPGPRRGGSRSEFNVVYSGNLGQFQDFETILGAAELLRDHPAVRFHIVGGGARARWLEAEVGRRGLSNVTLRPFLPDAEFHWMLLHAHLGLVTLEPNMEGLGVPSKTYNLLAMGVPLLAILGERSEVARIIAEYGVGYRVDRGDRAALAGCILDAYSNPAKWAEMSSRALAYAQAEATLHRAANQYAQAVESCLW